MQEPLFQARTWCSPKTPRSRMSLKHSRSTLRRMLNLQLQSACLLRTLSCHSGLPRTRIPPGKPSHPPPQTLEDSICRQRMRNLAYHEFLQGRNTPSGMWFLRLMSCRRRTRLRNTFPDQRCNRCTEGPLNLHRNCFGTCPLYSLGRSLCRPPTLRLPCRTQARTWCIALVTDLRTRLDTPPLDTLHNLRRCLLTPRRTHYDTTQEDTMEQPRMAHTLLCPTGLSCTCLGHTPRRFQRRCRCTRYGFRPADSLHTSRKHQPKSLHIRFEPDQPGSCRNLCKPRLPLW